MSEDDDRLLAVLAQNGDRGAFTTLMQRHKHWLLRSIRSHVRDGEDAADILQDSFVAAWMAIRTYDPLRPFETWLRRIALNKCRDHGRRRAVYAKATAAFGLLTNIIGGGRAEPEDQRARDDAAARLHAAIADLPETVRLPLVLTMLEDLSHKEAAELLDLTPKAIEVRIYRARKMLEKTLSPGDLDHLVAGEA